MRNSHYTKQERGMIFWLRILTVLFILLGFVFIFAPNYFLEYFDNFGAVFFQFYSRPLSPPDFELWRILSIASVFALAYVCLMAQLNWLRYHLLVPVLIWAKFFSGLGLGLLSYFRPEHFCYFVAGAIDTLLCIITLYAYLKALRSRSYSH